MYIKSKLDLPWLSVAAQLAAVFVLGACSTVGSPTSAATVTATAVATQSAALRLEDGAVKVRVQGEDDAWQPVAGESTFELVGEVQSTDPWMVTGNTFAIRDTTQIAEGVKVGDRVKVKGVILEDNTWLANSIELAREQMDPTIVLVGKVSSTDPWVVHGITLNVTADTIISPGLAPDMIALVEILLLEDGTWEVLSIAPLTNFTDIPGCATVMASVASVDGSKIQFRDWPELQLGEDVTIEDEDGNVTTLSAGQQVLVVVCATEDGQFAITKIVVLQSGEEEGLSDNAEKVLICHKPDKKGGHTLSVAAPAVPAHLAHGDKQGPCP